MNGSQRAHNVHREHFDFYSICLDWISYISIELILSTNWKCIAFKCSLTEKNKGSPFQLKTSPRSLNCFFRVFNWAQIEMTARKDNFPIYQDNHSIRQQQWSTSHATSWELLLCYWRLIWSQFSENSNLSNQHFSSLS